MLGLRAQDSVTVCNGGDECCDGITCGLGEGDCDSHENCVGHLRCGNDNCDGPGFDSTDDCCWEDPEFPRPTPKEDLEKCEIAEDLEKKIAQAAAAQGCDLPKGRPQSLSLNECAQVSCSADLIGKSFTCNNQDKDKTCKELLSLLDAMVQKRTNQCSKLLRSTSCTSAADCTSASEGSVCCTDTCCECDDSKGYVDNDDCDDNTDGPNCLGDECHLGEWGDDCWTAHKNKDAANNVPEGWTTTGTSCLAVQGSCGWCDTRYFAGCSTHCPTTLSYATSKTAVKDGIPACTYDDDGKWTAYTRLYYNKDVYVCKTTSPNRIYITYDGVDASDNSDLYAKVKAAATLMHSVTGGTAGQCYVVHCDDSDCNTCVQTSTIPTTCDDHVKTCATVKDLGDCANDCPSSGFTTAVCGSDCTATDMVV